MSERDVEARTENEPSPEEDEDRGATVFALSAVSVSGFIMGLMVRGEGILILVTTVLVPALIWSGWWLRGAVRPAGLPFGR